MPKLGSLEGFGSLESVGVGGPEGRALMRGSL